MQQYKKIGGGVFRIGNRLIKPNETFQMGDDWQIPKAFADSIIAIEQIKMRVRKPTDTEQAPVAEKTSEQDKTESTAEFKVSYTKQRTEPAGWFNVVGRDGKPVNEKKLREADAAELVTQLNE
jgi:hypothetical protein